MPMRYLQLNGYVIVADEDCTESRYGKRSIMISLLATCCFVRRHDAHNAGNQEHNDADDFRIRSAKMSNQVAKFTAHTAQVGRTCRVKRHLVVVNT